MKLVLNEWRRGINEYMDFILIYLVAYGIMWDLAIAMDYARKFI